MFHQCDRTTGTAQPTTNQVQVPGPQGAKENPMTDRETFSPTKETFEAICRAVMETDRGRWFLTEFARQNRAADTKDILNKLDEMRHAFTPRADAPDAAGSSGSPEKVIRHQLEEISTSIQAARKEILAIKPRNGATENLSAATEELDAIVDSTEKATTDILTSAEALQDHANNLRELGVDGSICDDIDMHATNIFMACSFQDITGQRTTKVMHAIRGLDDRVKAMLQVWQDQHHSEPDKPNLSITAPDDPRPDAHLLNGPQLEGDGKSQDEIDRMLSTQIDELEAEEVAEKLAAAPVAAESAPEVETAAESTPAPDPDLEDGGEEIAQDDIDALFDNEVA